MVPLRTVCGAKLLYLFPSLPVQTSLLIRLSDFFFPLLSPASLSSQTSQFVNIWKHFHLTLCHSRNRCEQTPQTQNTNILFFFFLFCSVLDLCALTNGNVSVNCCTVKSLQSSLIRGANRLWIQRRFELADAPMVACALIFWGVDSRSLFACALMWHKACGHALLISSYCTWSWIQWGELLPYFIEHHQCCLAWLYPCSVAWRQSKKKKKKKVRGRVVNWAEIKCHELLKPQKSSDWFLG